MPRAIARCLFARPMITDARPAATRVRCVRARFEDADRDPAARGAFRRNSERTSRVERPSRQALGEHVLGADAAESREFKIGIAHEAVRRARCPRGDRRVRAARRFADEKATVRGAFTTCRRRFHARIAGASRCTALAHRGRITQTRRRVWITARATLAPDGRTHDHHTSQHASMRSHTARCDEQVMRHSTRALTQVNYAKAESRGTIDAHTLHSALVRRRASQRHPSFSLNANWINGVPRSRSCHATTRSTRSLK